MRRSPGKIRPIAPTTSAAPRNRTNSPGSGIGICFSSTSRGTISFIPPVNRKSNMSNPWTIQSAYVGIGLFAGALPLPCSIVIVIIVDSPFDLVTPRIRLAPRLKQSRFAAKACSASAYQQHVCHSRAFIGKSNGKCSNRHPKPKNIDHSGIIPDRLRRGMTFHWKVEGFGHYPGGPIWNWARRAGLHFGDGVESGLRPAVRACEQLQRVETARNYLKVGFGGAHAASNQRLMYISAWASPQ